MTRIFPCNYATPEERAAAVAVWIKASLELGAPLKIWNAASRAADVQSENGKNHRKDLGATEAWKVKIPEFNPQYWDALLEAAIAKPAAPGLKGRPAAQEMHARSSGTALRLLQIDNAGTEYLASFAPFSDTPGSWFLFDPKTGLWKVGNNDVADFCNHMEANYKGGNDIELRAWVVPIPVNLHTTWIGLPASDSKDIKCANELSIAKFSADIRPKLRFCCLKEFESSFRTRLHRGVELVFLEDELPALNALANGTRPLTQPDFNDLEASIATILWEFTKYMRTDKADDRRYLAFAKDIWSLCCLYKFGGYHFDAGIAVLDSTQQVNLPAPSTFGAMLYMENATGTAKYVHLSAADYSGSANAGLKCMLVSGLGYYGNILSQKLTANDIRVAEIKGIDVPVLRSPPGGDGIKRALQTYIYLWFALKEASITLDEPYRLLSVSSAATGITHWDADCPASGVPAGSIFALEREMNLKKFSYNTHRVTATGST